MSSPVLPPPAESDDEISVLISTLHQTEQRLEALTGGEVDTVSDSHGRSYVLRRAQEQLRESEAGKLSAILNALPAHIALLDPLGFIVTVNGAWRQAATANFLQGPDFGPGLNYLELCDRTPAPHLFEARQAAAGIRSVLAGARSFSTEYSCHSPGEQHWFLLTVTALTGTRTRGAVVMHLDITERKVAENALSESQINMAAAQQIGHFGSWELKLPAGDMDGSTLHWSDEMFRIAGFEPGKVEISNEFFFSRVPPDEHAAIRRSLAVAIQERKQYSQVHRIIRADGEECVVQETAQVFFDDKTGLPVRIIGTAHDITARKLAETTMRAANEKFHQLADNITDAFWIRSPDFSEIQYISPAFERIWGRSVQSLLADPHQWVNFIYPEDRARVSAAFAALTGDAPRLEIEYRIVRPDGELRWVSVRGFQIRDGEGELIRHVGIATDITERKGTEDALRASELEFRTLAEAMPQIVWITRPDGENIYFNQQWMEYTGLTLAESLGDGWNQPFHPDDRKRAWESWRNATANGGAYGLECRLRRADGVFRWWLIRGVPIRDAYGNTLKWFGTCTDIDEFKQAQARIEEQAALLDIAHEAILVRDLDDRIVYWNQGAVKTFGWTTAEALGRGSLELLHSDPARTQELVAKLMAGGKWHGELIKRTKEGREITLDASWTLVRDAQGRPKSILEINNDITRKKKLEAQYLRNQRMESIGTLAGGIAHDLNNVLAPILMSIEMLKGAVTDEATRSMLATLQNSAQRGAELVRQVLSFARGVETLSVVVNLVHILREIKSIVRDTFPKTITFNLRPARELWTVNGDPTQLHQIFMNLCVNARDAMPSGGMLDVGIENIVLDETYAAMNPESHVGAFVMVTMTDTGSGIPPEACERIFEPFFTTKDIGKGTGLGLSTTLAIVKAHQGFISLYSEVGRGTRFKVYLPANTTATAADKAAIEPAEPLSGNGELVLVVDDEEGIRTITAKTLEHFGYSVLLAANGAEAVALYVRHQTKIAVVLTDMAMPVMDGPATIVALRSINPAVKIIGSSGLTSAGGVIKAIAAGVTHFIPKPYPATTLLNILQQILSNAENPSKPQLWGTES